MLNHGLTGENWQVFMSRKHDFQAVFDFCA